jgi:hypothetical protein
MAKSTALSTAHILSGDSRQGIDYVEQIFALFRQATDEIGRQPAGE